MKNHKPHFKQADANLFYIVLLFGAGSEGKRNPHADIWEGTLI